MQQKIYTIVLAFSLLFITAYPFNASAHGAGLPVGDGKTSSTTPQVGYVYSCQSTFNGGGAFKSGSWIQGNLWYPDLKPTVDGSVAWKNAKVTFSTSGTKRVINGNDLPINHNTGTFPISSTDDAYSYDRNPNSIKEQTTTTMELALNPTVASKPTCVGMGPIGIMTSGVLLFNALDDGGRDAVANEIQDDCNGHPQQQGQYHYHNLSPCLTKNLKPNAEALVGYSMDGFGIFTSYDSNGKKLTNADLDVCHGRTSEIMWEGKKVSMYHYVMTDEYPYSIGCFRGTPISSGKNNTGGQQGGMMKPMMTGTSSTTNVGQATSSVSNAFTSLIQRIRMRLSPTSSSQNQGQLAGSTSPNRSMMMTPPQDAINACKNLKEGSSCSFTNGPQDGSCRTMNSVMACFPPKPPIQNY